MSSRPAQTRDISKIVCVYVYLYYLKNLSAFTVGIPMLLPVYGFVVLFVCFFNVEHTSLLSLSQISLCRLVSTLQYKAAICDF